MKERKNETLFIENIKIHEDNNDNKQKFKKFLIYLLNPKNWDLSDYLLLLTNIFTIYWAISHKLGFSAIIWIYWFQSLIIGIFTILKIIFIKEFTTEGFLILEKPVETTKKGKIKAILMFIFVYSFFHMIYYIFLFNFLFNQKIENISSLIIYPVLIFFINHLLSFILNFKEDISKRKNIGEMIGMNIVRIFPIHFTIIFGGFFLFISSSFNKVLIIPLLLFMFLKTILELYTHKVEHHREEFDIFTKNATNKNKK